MGTFDTGDFGVTRYPRMESTGESREGMIIGRVCNPSRHRIVPSIFLRPNLDGLSVMPYDLSLQWRKSLYSRIQGSVPTYSGDRSRRPIPLLVLLDREVPDRLRWREERSIPAAAVLAIASFITITLIGCPNLGGGPSNGDFTVTYHPNGATAGEAPVDEAVYETGKLVTVSGNTGALSKSGSSFSGWNTREDGGGSTYAPGQKFPMGTEDVTLYARWIEGSGLTITYNGNESTSGEVPVDGTAYTEGMTAVLLGNPGDLARGDFTFMGWSTHADGSGPVYTEGDTLTVGSEPIILYARWVFYLCLSTGGPYETWISGPPLLLDASDNSGDPAATCEWDLDGDGAFDDASGYSAAVPWSTLSALLSGDQYPADPLSGLPTVNIAAKVTYDTDHTAIGETSLTIYRRQPVAVSHWAPQPSVPIVHPGASYTATVIMDNSGSYSGDPGCSIVDWACRPTGTSTWTTGETSSLTVDLSTSYPFPPAGILKNFTLQVTDTSGTVGEASFNVLFRQLAGTPPSIAFSNPRRGIFLEIGETFHADASATTDPDGYGIARVQWDLDHDGSWDVDLSGTVSDPPSLVLDAEWAELNGYPGLTEEGEHLVTLMVTNAIGVASIDTIKFTVVAHALRPVIDRDPAVAGPKDPITFDASRSKHLFPGCSISAYLWDLDGDGIYEADGAQVLQTFGQEGTWPVTLKVTDSYGRMNTTTAYITIP